MTDDERDTLLRQVKERDLTIQFQLQRAQAAERERDEARQRASDARDLFKRVFRALTEAKAKIAEQDDLLDAAEAALARAREEAFEEASALARAREALRAVWFRTTNARLGGWKDDGTAERALEFIEAEVRTALTALALARDTDTGSFPVGALVEKYTGDYQLPGEVRSVFTTRAGKTRYVVEHTPGFLHIYGPQNLRALDTDTGRNQP